jgi:hypothetical protein
MLSELLGDEATGRIWKKTPAIAAHVLPIVIVNYLKGYSYVYLNIQRYIGIV